MNINKKIKQACDNNVMVFDSENDFNHITFRLVALMSVCADNQDLGFLHTIYVDEHQYVDDDIQRFFKRVGIKIKRTQADMLTPFYESKCMLPAGDKTVALGLCGWRNKPILGSV